MALPSDYREQLLAKLAERKVRPICEICGQNNWAVIEQAVSIQITDISGAYRLPPPQIPCAGLVCNNCGNLRLFVLGALELLPGQPSGGEK
ncbi:MAG: hypothetical protein FJY85_11835 [Deltaproteobacteria bacterium]|nr:hypothetical protein [Deltaproteobacteria bacterium]